jgi:hypothetical protein
LERTHTDTMIASAEEFVRLRTSTEPQEYRRSATESAPLEVWRELIDKHPDMRVWVAHNKTVPGSVLSELAADTDPRVRFTVASRRRTDATTLRRLSTDADEGVRLAVARNPKTPEDVLERLESDLWAEVAQHARRRLRARLDGPE